MTTRSEELIGALDACFPTLDAEEQRIWISLVRALAEGQPVPPASVADDARVSEAAVHELLNERLGEGCRWYDEQGRVTAFGGLAIRPVTKHQMIVEGRTLRAWCALDTLFLPRMLGKPAEVRSVCPITHRPITLRVTPDRLEHVDPPDAVVSFIRCDRKRIEENAFLNFCSWVHFFASEEAGEQWQVQHPDSTLLTLEEGFAISRGFVTRKFCSWAQAALREV